MNKEQFNNSSVPMVTVKAINNETGVTSNTLTFDGPDAYSRALEYRDSLFVIDANDAAAVEYSDEVIGDLADGEEG